LSPLPLPPPPAELSSFPRRTPGGLLVHRIHRAGRAPWWFSNDGTGRFDLPAESGEGTCYLAIEPAGCFLEVFRAWTLVPEAEIEARRISQRTLTGIDLADLTSPACRGFGLTAEIHSTPDYAVTHRWAAALAAAGFAGICYLLRHDPSAHSAGVALFGPAGSASEPRSHAARIGPDLLEEVETRYRIRVWSTP
jgi:hypothetical protein